MRDLVLIERVEMVTFHIGEYQFLRVTTRDNRGVCRRNEILLDAQTYFLPIPEAVRGRN